jgi:predicted transposase/invertase (TIGR01784 family)
MITDPIFYRLFETSPETLFLLLGMSPESARDMAAHYEYEALEFKETAHRSDGIFRPTAPGLPLYFLEVQFYPLASVFADLMVKAFTFLKQHDPGQEFRGVVLFGSRALEPKETLPYKLFFDAGLIRRYYLDEMPAVTNAPVELAIMYLISQSEEQAPGLARELVARVKTEIGDEALRADLVDLVETIIMGKLPHLGREEIQVMLQLHDIRESRVYQEALQKGREEGVKKERRRSILQLAARKMRAEEIAECLELDVESVRETLMEAGNSASGAMKPAGRGRKRRGQSD